jgi:hypothetical protein
MRRVALPVILLLSLTCGVSSATAQDEEGVHADPNSPAGKEYAIPVEKARRDAGGALERGSSAQKPAAFGAGLKRKGEGANSGASADGQDDDSQDRRDALIAASSGNGGDGGGSAATTGLTGLAVVLLGLGLGFGLKRLGRREPGQEANA